MHCPRVLAATRLLRLLFPFAAVGPHGSHTVISHTHSKATGVGLDHPCTIFQNQNLVTIISPVLEHSTLQCTEAPKRQ